MEKCFRAEIFCTEAEQSESLQSPKQTQILLFFLLLPETLLQFAFMPSWKIKSAFRTGFETGRTSCVHKRHDLLVRHCFHFELCIGFGCRLIIHFLTFSDGRRSHFYGGRITIERFQPAYISQPLFPSFPLSNPLWI